METIKQKYPKFAEAIVKIFAVLGLIVIILIALYGAMAALRSIPNVWESMGNAFTSVTGVFDGEDEMELSVSPQTPVSGEIVTISFDKKGTGNGSYSFSYDCAEGINFEILSPDGASRTFAFCNTPTTFAASGNYVRVIPTLINKDVVSAPIKIDFTRNNDNEVSASGETQITVIKSSGSTANPPVSGPATTTPPTTKPPVNNPPSNPGYTIITAPRVPVLFGFPDLTVKILEVGTINKVTGVFTATTYITTADRVAVKFEVLNAGTNTAANWRFNASLPLEPYYLYPASIQPILNPGDKIIYTLGFDGIQNRSINQFSVIVDPDNMVQESNELNNTATRNITLNQGGQTGTIYLPISGASCFPLTGTYYSCTYNNVTYTNCYTFGNGFYCQNTTNTGSTINLPFGSSCYTSGINSAYSCSYNGVNYSNCYVTNTGYTCYNNNTNTGNYTLPENASCYVSGNAGQMTCTYNSVQYTGCYLTISNNYSCASTSGNQTGNYQLPSSSSCSYQTNGSYNCTSANGNYYSGCYLNSNGWNCTAQLGTNNQNGCYTTPSGARVCI